MPEHDRSRDQHPDNLVFWRISALEEAVKFQTTQIAEHRDQIANVRRDYVRREELVSNAAIGRDVWTLRLLALGTLLNGLGIVALFTVHT